MKLRLVDDKNQPKYPKDSKHFKVIAEREGNVLRTEIQNLGDGSMRARDLIDLVEKCLVSLYVSASGGELLSKSEEELKGFMLSATDSFRSNLEAGMA